jgi:hypothetical protein
VRRLLRRHLFLGIGLATLLLLYAVASMDRRVEYNAAATLPYPSAGAAQEVQQAPSATARVMLAGVMRVLIVPIYLVWMLIAMLLVAAEGPHGLPQPLATVVSGVSIVAGLAPYALADYVVERVRRRRAGN